MKIYNIDQVRVLKNQYRMPLKIKDTKYSLLLKVKL